MGHTHSVYDTDNHFKVNGITRAITNVSTSKVSVVQFDHNSERFTFEMPRFVEGHDMMLCDSVQVHYANVSGNRIERNDGIYEVDDLQTSPEDENIVICSWLISQNATQIVGSLLFLLRFVCSTDGEVDYAWHTAVYSGISVSNGMNNTGEIVDTYPDIIEEMLARIEELDGQIEELDGQTAFPARPGDKEGHYWTEAAKLHMQPNVGCGAIQTSDSTISIQAREDENSEFRGLYLRNAKYSPGMATCLRLRDEKGKYYYIYGEHNKPTPAAIGAATMAQVKAYVDEYIAEALGGEY
jgi:hypothetical protein